jgi:hypothetical protein
MVAACYDHSAIVEKLLIARADLSTKNISHGCALPVRRFRRRRRMGSRLRLAPAPSGRDTALHIAAGYGYTKSAVALLVGGADQTITNKIG